MREVTGKKSFYVLMIAVLVVSVVDCRLAAADGNSGQTTVAPAGSDDKYNIYLHVDMKDIGGPAYAGMYIDKFIPRRDSKYVKKNIIYAFAKKIGLNVVENKSEDLSGNNESSSAKGGTNEFYKREKVDLEIPAVNKFRFYGQELVITPRMDVGGGDVRAVLKVKPADWIKGSFRVNMSGVSQEMSNFVTKFEAAPTSNTRMVYKFSKDMKDGVSTYMAESYRLSNDLSIKFSQEHAPSELHHPLITRYGFNRLHKGNWSTEVYLEKQHGVTALMASVTFGVGEAARW